MDMVIDARVEALRNAPLDAWIALSPDESTVVATGATYMEVVLKSENAGIGDPVVIKTPKDWLPISL
jgi:hypothetical protein